jgi:MauM/NapG family ferredoxin protein
MRFRRLIQGASLLLFAGLLILSSHTLAERMRPDLFLRMDPLVLFAGLSAGRVSLELLLPGLVVILLTLVLGRFFCSFLCPLGTTVDITDRLLGRIRKRLRVKVNRSAGLWRYFILAFAAVSVLAGSSLFLLVSPLSLATRFYGLILSPALASLLDLGAGLLRGAGAFEYLSIPVPAYALAWATLAMIALVLGLGILAPRFWCRYLCPSGAVLSLLSLGRLLKREVSDACTGCGKCAKACPMAAVGTDPRESDKAGCIACGECARACPEDAVDFSLRKRAHGPGFSGNRRTLLLSGLAGAAGGLLALLLPGGVKAGVLRAQAIRPPGALPERGFLAGCARCGECMKACPTNTLQPSPLAGGTAGFFTPVVSPRTGPCEPTCTRCGRVCPTGVLRTLSREEKVWAKIGTASVDRHRCIAWESGRACLVCYEVCPFGAIELKRASGAEVPVVDPGRCSGCGFCEYNCPVAGISAIRVMPEGALRLREGSYHEEARRSGLRLEVKQPGSGVEEGAPVPGEGNLPPGFEG